jgi:GNAT superfamily N-acetyltransferase
MNLAQPYEIEKEGFLISTDKRLLDLKTIVDFLHNHSYWANTRPVELIQRTIEHSLCFGIYTTSKKQVGFARVVTDYATFAYLADVFVIPGYRGRGLSKWLMETILACPFLQDVYLFTLYTKDAHGLYEKFGFRRLDDPERFEKFMERFLVKK